MDVGGNENPEYHERSPRTAARRSRSVEVARSIRLLAAGAMFACSGYGAFARFEILMALRP